MLLFITMNISDRTLGYLVIAFVILAISWSSYEILKTNNHTLYQVTVEFDDVGSLQPQDPVMDRGMRVGQIAAVNYRNGKAHVLIDFDSPLIIREGTIFRNTNFSLMGDRLVEMKMSQEGDRYSPGDVVPGIYEPGIAEALHLVEGVLKEVHILHQTMMLLNNGDSTHQPLSDQVSGLMQATEGLIKNLDQVATKYHPTLQKLLKQSTQLTEATIDFVGQTQEGLDTLYSVAQNGLSNASQLTADVDTLLHALNQTTQTFENSAFYNNHLTTRELVNDLQNIQQSVQAILNFLGNDKGVVPDSTGNKSGLVGLKNINLFGKTAREKRKERQEQGQ